MYLPRSVQWLPVYDGFNFPNFCMKKPLCCGHFLSTSCFYWSVSRATFWYSCFPYVWFIYLRLHWLNSYTLFFVMFHSNLIEYDSVFWFLIFLCDVEKESWNTRASLKKFTTTTAFTKIFLLTQNRCSSQNLHIVLVWYCVVSELVNQKYTSNLVFVYIYTHLYKGDVFFKSLSLFL